MTTTCLLEPTTLPVYEPVVDNETHAAGGASAASPGVRGSAGRAVCDGDVVTEILRVWGPLIVWRDGRDLIPGCNETP